MLAALAIAVAVAAAASGGSGDRAPSTDATGQAQAPPLPSPAEPIPRTPARLAKSLTTTTLSLREAIDRWRTGGDPSRGDPPSDVTLLALYQQRIYLLLTDRPKLADRTLPRLPGSVRAEARDTLGARRSLKRLARGTPRTRRFKTGSALPADLLLRLYRKAQRRYGVSWHVLAAVNFVATGCNRLRINITAGANGR